MNVCQWNAWLMLEVELDAGSSCCDRGLGLPSIFIDAGGFR